MKKKLLVIMMAAMMLSVTACGQNTSVVNDSQGQEISDTGAEDSSNESSSEVDYDTTDMELYTDKDGNVYYYDISCIPDWWTDKVEVVNYGGTMYLVCVIEVPKTVYLFDEKNLDRVSCTEEEYNNGEFHCNSPQLKKYVPEGWEIDYSKSTSSYKYLYNKELDVEVEIHFTGEYDANMYKFDNHYEIGTSEPKIYWVTEIDGKDEAVLEAPDYIDYTVQNYEEYMGYEPGTIYSSMGGPLGTPYLWVRTHSDGRVYYDCFWRTDIGPAMISITEENAKKMQNVGTYMDIYEQVGMFGLPEDECEFAVFAYIYLDKDRYLKPEDKWYWKNRVL